MLPFLEFARLWGIRLLVAVGLAVSAYQVGFRPVAYLCRTAPVVGSRPLNWRDWAIAREWIVVFILINASVLCASLFNVDTSSKTSLLQIVLDDPLISAQLAGLLLAAAFAIGDSGSDGHVVKAPHPRTRVDLAFALVLTVLANLLALVDSLATWTRGDIGPIHFGIWMVQNIGCVYFASFLLVRVLRGSYAYLLSHRVLWLWWIALVLMSASTADLLVPVGR